MFRHAARLTTVLAGVAVTGLLLVGAPADAHEVTTPTPAPVPVPGPIVLPVNFPCTLTYTNVIVGTEEDDALYGTTGNDLIIGLGGDDYIFGDRGRDTIIGGDGDDLMDGAQGNDCLNGGLGDDESVWHEVIMSNGTDDTTSAAYRYDY